MGMQILGYSLTLGLPDLIVAIGPDGDRFHDQRFAIGI
jgi:hypothetical protein